MSKTIKIIIISAGILLIVLAGYLIVSRPKNPTAPTNPVSAPPNMGFTIPSEGAQKMTVSDSTKTEGGEQGLEINNVYQDPVAKLSYNGVLFKETADYSLAFYPEDKFIISIRSFDLNPAREKAEVVFLETLGITKEQACELNVSLGTTFDISQKNAGREFGLSFCPDGKPFQ